MLIHNLLEISAKRFPEKVAVIHDHNRVTYSQLITQSNQIANHLLYSGIKNGDRVAILLENCVDYITAYYAILKVGAVAAPLNPGLKPDGLQYHLNDLEPFAIVTNFKAERLLKATELSLPTLKSIIIRSPKQAWPNAPYAVSPLEDIITNITVHAGGTGLDSVNKCLSCHSLDVKSDESEVIGAEQSRGLVTSMSPENLSSIIYTSGSTGEPKGVMLSHRNIVSNTQSICQYLNITSQDIQMVVLPFFYVMGKSLLNTHIAAGGTLVLNNRFMYPADVVNQMIEEKVTSFSGVPSTYAYLLNRSPLASHKDKLSCLRYCSQAGGHMAKALKFALRRTLPHHTQIVVMYGATEAAARLTYLEPAYFESKIQSIGRPIPGVTIRILDDAGREVIDGAEGELVAQGTNIMQGYWKAPKDTERVLTREGYHTGDIGYRDADGFLFVKGRKDGLLKVGGHRINPVEIEDFLMTTDLLIEAAVIGLPDELMGKKMVALAVPKDDNLNVDILLEHCAAGLPKHKMPSKIISLKNLPKNANGKVDHDSCVNTALSKANQDNQQPQ